MDDEHQPTQIQKKRIEIYPDADPHNANWIRILQQERLRKQQEQQQQPRATRQPTADTRCIAFSDANRYSDNLC